MNIYYTTPQVTGAVQPFKEFSLGGFKSSNLVNDLFSDISMYTEDKMQDEYVGLILWNDSGELAESIELWFNYPVDDNNIQTNLAKLSVAAVALDSKNTMQHVGNSSTKPSNVTFYEADGQDNAVGLGDLDINKGLGIWIKRSLIKERITAKKVNDTLNYNYQNNIQLITLEEIKLSINWGTQYYPGNLGADNI